ncbi:Putative Flp pilus-assembly TadE/G-like [Lysobacter spongiicola DSM 21749]|uniref:Putative Flp pilus-assembly TadE/G-like n=1 Tax=Lysobacter spongiicola DSM 21749 TaxID=1122188 RepID=A0A1T4PZI1_9GAMM|nr:Putative Flp pilus-assembly TadE/G-like [Lysobacter spongiicola DSM 21749]
MGVQALLSNRNRTAPGTRKHRGQALVLGMVFLLVLAVGTVLLFNTGQVVHRKVQLTNAADAAAYSVAVQNARAWNLAAYMNRGRVANEVAVAQFVSLYSWLNHLNTASFILKTFFETLGSIPFPPVAIPARILATAFKIADQTLKSIRGPARQAIQAAITVLDEFNRLWAYVAITAITAVSKADAIFTANEIIKANVDQARLTALGATVLGSQLVASQSNFIDFHRLPRFGQSEPFNRYRNVVMQSRDRFSWNRGQSTPGPVKFATYGGTDMVNYDRWVAMDTMQIKIDLPRWLGGDIELPVGWGGAQAVDRYQNQRFLPGFNNNRGWRSPFDNRRYGIYGGMNPRSYITELAAGDPNVSLHGGKAKDAYFTGYRGLRDYHDLKPGQKGTPGSGPVFTVEATLDMREARTSSTVGLSSGRMELREQTRQLSTLASAEVYFERPPTLNLFRRDDGMREWGSLFSPYWQARLIETPAAVRNSLGLAGGVL